MTALEIVKKDTPGNGGATGRVTGSLGVFIGSVLGVIALSFMLALGFFVVDMREDAKLLDLKVQKLQNEVSYLKGQLNMKDTEERKP